MSARSRAWVGIGLMLSLGRHSWAQTISNVSSSACPSAGGAHIVVARASDEAPGYGIIGTVKDLVLAQVPGSTAEAVAYPATLTDYIDSETQGVIAMRALIDAFISNCTGTPLVVMGYSQGAQVTADSLVGQVDHSFPLNSSVDTPLSYSTLARTAAVIMMGDPTCLANETFKIGDSTKNSVFPREDVSNFGIANLAARTQSYCNADDPYCAAGSNLTVHLIYVEEYGTAAADFVVAQIKAWYGNSTSVANGTSNATSTATGTGVGKKTSTATLTSATQSSSTTSSSSSTSTSTGAASRLQGGVLVGTLSSAMLGGLFAWLL